MFHTNSFLLQSFCNEKRLHIVILSLNRTKCFSVGFIQNKAFCAVNTVVGKNLLGRFIEQLQKDKLTAGRHLIEPVLCQK